MNGLLEVVLATNEKRAAELAALGIEGALIDRLMGEVAGALERFTDDVEVIVQRYENEARERIGRNVLPFRRG